MSPTIPPTATGVPPAGVGAGVAVWPATVGDGLGDGVGVCGGGDGDGDGEGVGDGDGDGVGALMLVDPLALAELLEVFGSVTCRTSSRVTVAEPLNECGPLPVQVTDQIGAAGRAVLATSAEFCGPWVVLGVFVQSPGTVRAIDRSAFAGE